MDHKTEANKKFQTLDDYEQYLEELHDLVVVTRHEAEQEKENLVALKEKLSNLE